MKIRTCQSKNWGFFEKFSNPFPLGQKYLDRGLCEFAFSHFVFRCMIKSLCPNSKMSSAWFVASNLKHGLKSIWIKSIPLIVNSVFFLLNRICKICKNWRFTYSYNRLTFPWVKPISKDDLTYIIWIVI